MIYIGFWILCGILSASILTLYVSESRNNGNIVIIKEDVYVILVCIACGCASFLLILIGIYFDYKNRK